MWSRDQIYLKFKDIQQKGATKLKFVVTGGAGFVGSHLAKYLLSQKHSVTIVDNLGNGKIENLNNVKNEIDFHQIDILNFDKLKDILKHTDGVFHEAALISLQASYEKPEEYHKVNVEGTENIFKLALEFGFKVIFASSSSIYGEVDKIPITEDFKKNPSSPYAETKVQDEILASKYIQLSVPIIGLRYFNIFGKGQSSSYAGVITKFMQRITEKKPPIIFGDGLQVRDFVYVKDVAKANLNAMESKVNEGFFNVGSGKATSILDLANIFIKASRLKLELKFEKPPKGDVKMSLADLTLIKKTLNWQPETKLEDWIKKVIS